MSTTAINFGAAADPAGDQAQTDHNKAMADKFDATQQAAQTSAQPTSGNPPATAELIGGKFKSQDDLLAAYKSLEAKLGAPKAPEVPPVVPTAPVTPPAVDPNAPLQIDAAAQTVADAGLDMAALSAKWSTKGDLDEADYAQLAKAGVTKETVATFAAGQQALATQARTSLLTDTGIGSEDNLKSVFEWAGKNIPAAEVEAINETFAKGSLTQQRLALEAVHARYQRSQGSEPKLVQGQAVAATGDVYQSQDQWKADMRDPRYGKDSAFRANVAAKLGRSNI